MIEKRILCACYVTNMNLSVIKTIFMHNNFEIEFQDNHDVYLATNVLLLADIFQTCMKHCK